MRPNFPCLLACSVVLAFFFGSVSLAATTSLISINSAGTAGNHNSSEAAISADGRYVVFESKADDLVPEDTNNRTDIFVHDRQTGQTKLISRDSTGQPGNEDSTEPAISGNGRYIAFESKAGNLVPGDTNDNQDVFVHDLQTGRTWLISKDSAGRPANGLSYLPCLSTDGRYVAFSSSAVNIVSDDTNNRMDIFVHDRQTGKTKLISRDSTGQPGNGDSSEPAMSADGRYVAYESKANNLVPNDTNSRTDIFVHDRTTGRTKLVSRSSAGIPANNDSAHPAISADGRYIAFESTADNLAPGDTNGKTDIFVHDRTTGRTKLVSRSSAGNRANNHSSYPSISRNGRQVAFQSEADNLVPGDRNGKTDVFVHDTRSGKTDIISVSNAGIPGDNEGCFEPSISADGRHVAFATEAGNLVPGDGNGLSDVFVRTIQ